MPIKTDHCGWVSTLQEFLAVDLITWGKALVAYHTAELNEQPSNLQKRAWMDCYEHLQKCLPYLVECHPQAKTWSIIFEYELPRERGRRPDVVLLSEENIFVLEFKQYDHLEQAHLDQVLAYACDLGNYHGGSHQFRIFPFLVITKAQNVMEQSESAWSVSPDRLSELISVVTRENNMPLIDPIKWIEADYDPLPTLVDAARRLFAHEPLPQIRTAQSAGIPDTVRELVEIASIVQEKGEHHLALVTGVPGSGKTLVGLQLVYESHFKDAGSNRSAIFLSGNGPLVSVLQDTLQDHIFVNGVHGFLKTYGRAGSKPPEESVIIFDEAQRAWDEERVRSKRGERFSEPEQFLQIGSRKKWCLMVALVGEGQEIYLGEESGIQQWGIAVTHSEAKWTVHCPKKLNYLFSTQKTELSEQLDLTISLRSHLAEEVQTWGQRILGGDFEEASKLTTKIRDSKFQIYLTRDIGVAKSYLKERYKNQIDKRYGLIASSQAKNLRSITGPRINPGDRAPWYNALPSNPRSCCQLNQAASEFECQGLELDFPIVCWGTDLTWNSQWINQPPDEPKSARDPYKLRINTYRVLLSRGRDGMIIFIPDIEEMQSTYNILLASGAQLLNQ